MDQKLKFNCKCPLLEIYNEQIIDLLDTSPTSLLVFSVFYLDYYDNYNELRYCISSDHHISYFMLREDTKKGVYVENLSELRVQAVGDILELLRQVTEYYCLYRLAITIILVHAGCSDILRCFKMVNFNLLL